MYKIYIDNDLTHAEFDLDLLYSADAENMASGYVVYNAAAEKELNSAGSMNFTVPPNNPEYGNIYKLKTSVFVFWESDLLWSGRVLSVSYDLSRNKLVQCEGTLAFLNDIQIKPFIYSTKQSLSSHFSNIFSKYNNRCSAKRTFADISTSFPSSFLSTDVYSSSGVTSYISAKEEIDNIRAYDGAVALAVIYSGLAIPTLYFGTVPIQTIENEINFGENMLDFSESEEGSQIFTSVIPLGDDSLTLDDTAYSVSSNTLVGEYGIIESVVQINGIKSRTALASAAQNILTSAENAEKPKLTIKAVDLKWTDSAIPHFIEIGDAVPIRYTQLGIHHYYLCEKISFDFADPAGTSYTFAYLGEEIPTSASSYSVQNTGYIKNDVELSSYVLDSTKSIDAQAQTNVRRPTSVAVSPNEVTINYNDYSVKYQADGSGTSRNNVRATIIQGN